MPRAVPRLTAGYILALTGSFVLAAVAGWTSLGEQIDYYASDFLLRLNPPPASPSRSIVLAIDEATLKEARGRRQLRQYLARGLERIAEAGPSAVAIDVILADEGDAAEDAALESALSRLPRLVLASELTSDGTWENPLPRFRKHAAAVGHVHAEPDLDGVSRRLPLEKVSGSDRRWAMALEAYRLSANAPSIVESASELDLGGLVIPSRRSEGRPLVVRYRSPESPVEQVSLKKAIESPELASRFKGKAVFVGMTAQTEVRDRLMTPVSYTLPMPGVEMHAHAYETLADGRFLRAAPTSGIIALSMALVIAAGLSLALLAGRPAWIAGAAILIVPHVLPVFFLKQDIVFPLFLPVSAAWLSVVTAASWRHFVVRRQLADSEAERGRYQQAIHFVAHEMRTPLTAIQGSSELMNRYKLSEDKQREFASMIHSESRRLAQLIQTFLDVERLSAGQMELKKEPFALKELVGATLDRAKPLAARKNIEIQLEVLPDATLLGDRELMEYAVYNLLNNAVKYSPANTTVTIRAEASGTQVRLFVRDQGIGMDAQDVRNIFKKFYRTRQAEASGEVGTGIGLSIVEQIVTHHGGRIDVTSEVGKGSCFTLILPISVSAAVEKS